MKSKRMISSLAILFLVVLSGNSIASVTEAVGNMNVPRYRHNMQLLEGQDKVLVFGGRNVRGSLLEAELYDPVTGEFTLTTSMNRTDYVMYKSVIPMPIRMMVTIKCIMPNTDNLLFIGGFGRPEIFDPATQTWTLLYMAPDQNEPGGPGSVYDHGWGQLCCTQGCVIRDGSPGNHIFLFAGHAANMGLMELYSYQDNDPYKGTFNILKDANDPTGYLVDLCVDRRPGSRIEWAQLSETRILITGMISPSRINVVQEGVAMVLDTHGDAEFSTTLTPTGLQNTPRTYAHLAKLPDGKAMIMCGQDKNGNLLNSCEIYDPNTNEWTPTGSMITARDDFAYCTLADGRIAVFGGRGRSGSGGCGDDAKPGTPPANVLDTIEIYDPKTGVWVEAGSMIYARHLPRAELLPDNTVLISGGKNKVVQNNTTVVIAQAEVFTPPHTLGDINLDGKVNCDDIEILIENWGATGCGPYSWCNRADINQNGVVDIDDLQIITDNWTQSQK